MYRSYETARPNPCGFSRKAKGNFEVFSMTPLTSLAFFGIVAAHALASAAAPAKSNGTSIVAAYTVSIHRPNYRRLALHYFIRLRLLLPSPTTKPACAHHHACCALT